MRCVALATCLFLLSLTAVAQEEKIQLKDVPGRDAVVRNCQTCHSLDYIVMNSPFLDRKGWEASATKMVKVMGAPVPKDQLPTIVDYLTANYGKQ